MMPLDDLTGKYIGELYVIGRSFEEQNKRNSTHPYYDCLCSCGKNVIKSTNYLHSKTQKYPKSCGHIAEQIKHMSKNGKTNKYEFVGDIGIGYTHDNRRFIFDKEDFEKIKKYCWRFSTGGYIVANSKDCNNNTIWLHRLVMDADEREDDILVDHKNWDTSNCCKKYLRFAIRTENNINIHRKKNNTSGYTGVTQTRNKKWLARISKNGIRYNLGTYDTFEEAVEVRHRAEFLLHQEWSGEINRRDFERIFSDNSDVSDMEEAEDLLVEGV